jgi:hypothetical protein
MLTGANPMPMYKIIGTDQQEYGPVSADDIRQWIADGRITAQTNAIAEGGTEWKPLAAFPEFAGALAAAARTALPVATFAARPSPAPSASFAAPRPRAKTSGMAIASLILGILGVFSCGITALVGLILGFLARGKIRKSQGSLRGGGIALAGTIVSGVCLLATATILAVIVLPRLSEAKQVANTILCANNMRTLNMAMHLYSNGHNGQFPPAATWCDAILVFAGGSEKTFQCPAGDGSKRCNYAFNAKLGGAAMNRVNPNTVLFFETDGGWNASGGPELMLQQLRHTRPLHANETAPTKVGLVAFVNGQVEQLPATALATLRWNP